mmetsp:Transcript_111506/g.248885  ORF Transcript_111506/g.248885 Transcript_111506/m.248885 type:complete len:342 (-) Transcript_111506:993-2018(-)
MLHVFLDGAGLVDHHPFVRCILSHVGHDRLHTAGMDGDPLSDIDGVPEKDYPSIILLVVLGDLIEADSTRISRSATSGSDRSSTSRPDLPHDRQVLRVLLHRAGLVDHLPLLSSICAREGHDGLDAARVDGDPLRHIDNITEKDDPAVVLLVVILDVLERDRRRALWRRRRHHGACSLQSLNLLYELLLGHVLRLLIILRLLLLRRRHIRRRCQTAKNQLLQLLSGHALTLEGHHRSGIARCSAREDGLEQRDARQAPQLLRGGGSDLAGRKEPLDGCAAGREDLPLRACYEAASAGVERRRDCGDEEGRGAKEPSECRRGHPHLGGQRFDGVELLHDAPL